MHDAMCPYHLLPNSALSRRNEKEPFRIFRYAETGVSVSARNSLYTGIRFPSDANRSNAGNDGMLSTSPPQMQKGREVLEPHGLFSGRETKKPRGLQEMTPRF